MRVAVIDLGTNTFHLLIAEGRPGGKPAVLHRETFVAKIGQGGISQGILTDEAFTRTLSALEGFRRQIDTFGVAPESVFATATSAIRNARNGAALVEAVARQTGITVRVISGDQEAGYIYDGVRSAVPLGTATSLVMDIGGGSVEFILANAEKIYWKRSFEIGAQRLLDQYLTTDPISPAAVRRLHDYLEETLIPLTNAVHQYQPTALVGASGAFETLCAIDAEKRGESLDVITLVEGTLELSSFQAILQQLLTNDRAGRLAIPGMLPMRVDMIVVASCLLDFVLRKYDLHRIRVSGYALKEGVLSQLLAVP
jgi:exopolyphosphatase/guanosine-5'-triphosphate,3'-diphosphate pyrophosphatase